MTAAMGARGAFRTIDKMSSKPAAMAGCVEVIRSAASPGGVLSLEVGIVLTCLFPGGSPPIESPPAALAATLSGVTTPTPVVTPPLGSHAKPARLVVLVSGGGSNLAALISACADPAYGATVVAVGADRTGTGGAALAEDAGIATFVTRVGDYPNRQAWDHALTAAVAAHEPDLVISAGFLKLCGPEFVARFSGRYLNTHNSLLPSFAGIRGPAEALAYGVKLAGATLFVVDEGVDTGVVLAQVAVPVEFDDTEDSLLERIKTAERAQLVDVVGRMCREGWSVAGRRTRIGS